jgi:hypothetical protein
MSNGPGDICYPTQHLRNEEIQHRLDLRSQHRPWRLTRTGIIARPTVSHCSANLRLSFQSSRCGLMAVAMGPVWQRLSGYDAGPSDQSGFASIASRILAWGRRTRYWKGTKICEVSRMLNWGPSVTFLGVVQLTSDIASLCPTLHSIGSYGFGGSYKLMRTQQQRGSD